MRAYACAFAALALSAPATAGWYRASSEHFIIYSDQLPEKLRQFAENLERFDGAVRAVRGMDDLPLSQGNRVTIFRLHSAEEVQRLANDKSGFIRGFYRGSAAGSIAFVGPGEASNAQTMIVPASNIRYQAPNTNLGENTILLHEYSHHLMMQDLRVPYPEWLVEGFAEFMSTAQFEKDGRVGLGLPATHRYSGLINGIALPLKTLLSGSDDKFTTEQRESLYGRGWLLTHYLTFEPSRKGQLAAYLTALSQGVSSLTAASQSFGDLNQLDRDLNAYLTHSKLHYLKISGAGLAFAPVQITPLTPGGSAVVPMLVELKNGVSENDAEALAAKIRGIYARYPGNGLVATTLAEAELDAGHPEAAEAAADRAIQANPRNTDAIILKGRSIAARAQKARGAAGNALFGQARKTFSSANAIDPEDPEPLMEFYKAYVQQGIPPTSNAVAALHYASDLAPQDLGLRMNSAIAYLIEGKKVEASRALIPIAYDPHGKDFADLARRMMDRIAAGDTQGALAVTSSGTQETAKTP